MDREEAAKELMAMLEEAQEGPYYSEEEVRAHLLEILDPRNQVYMTGDTHGQFERVIEFCARREVEPENTFVILGDAGLNYYNDRRDRKKKDQLAQVPITFFCLHGNHEMRPSEALGYELAEFTVARYGCSRLILISCSLLTARSMTSMAIPALSSAAPTAWINTIVWPVVGAGSQMNSLPKKSKPRWSASSPSATGRLILCCLIPAR